MRCDPIVSPEFAGSPAVRSCIGCGCTDARACAGGCSWICIDPPICSRCPDMLDAIEVEADDAGDVRSGMFGAARCPASQAPALHAPIWIDATTGYCARCRQGFIT